MYSMEINDARGSVGKFSGTARVKSPFLDYAAVSLTCGYFVCSEDDRC
jgi:hypothetical protein